MTNDFSGGYFKALIDVYNALNNINIKNIDSKEKYDCFVKSFLSLLITHGNIREDMIRCGFDVTNLRSKFVIENDGRVRYDENGNS